MAAELHSVTRPAKGITARLRATKRRRQQTADAAVYAAVDARDGCRSRLSGIVGAIEHHHIVYRSLGGKTTTANVISLTPSEHELVHAKRIVIRPQTEAGADGPCGFLIWDGRDFR